MVVMMGAWAASITFHVNTPNGQTMTREYVGGDSPSMIKDHVEDWSNGIYASAHQHLFYNDVELDDSQQLFQLGFTEGNSYTLTLTYTDPTQPQRVTNNNWRVQTMPRGDRVLRTIWKQACELAFEKDTTVYRVFTSTLQNPLTNPHNLDVTYSSSNTNVATVATDGTVTVKGVGNATITATTTGNNDYQACSASYNIQVKEPYKLTLLTVGNGTVDTDGIMPGVILDTANYNDGNKHYLVMPGVTVVDLKATPAPLNYLAFWTNAEKGDVDTNFAVVQIESSDMSVTATFVTYPILVVEQEGVGSVTVEKKENSTYVDITNTSTNNEYTLPPGTEVRLTATAGANNHFDNWSWGTGTEAQTTDNNPITVTMPNYLTVPSDGLVKRKATFAIDTYTLSLVAGEHGSLDLYSTPQTGVQVKDAYNETTRTRTYTVNYGTEVVLQATPADHHHLASWSNGAMLKELDTIHVTVTKDSTITANFAIDTFKLTLAKSGNGAVDTMGVIPGVVYYGLVDGNKTYIVDYNTPVTVKATADEHNHFVNWTNEGNTAYNATNVTTDAGTYPVHSYLTFNVTGDTTAQGNFAVNTYDITATVATNCDGMGTVSGGGTYNEDAQVNLTATPNTGYHFVNWTKTGVVVSTTATYNFNATAETAGDYIANFAINTYTLTLSTNPTDGSLGTLDVVRNNNNELPAGVTGTYPNYTVNEGVYVPLVIAPATHYHLVSLIGGTNQPITYSDNHASIAVVKDTTITATFSIDTYVITAAANNSTLGSVTVSGTSPYDYGTEVTLTAQTTDSTHFVNWTKEGETDPVSTDATYIFTAEAAGNYTANFAINPTLKLVADGHGTVDTVGVIAGVALKSAADKEYYVVPGTVVSVKAKPDAGFVFVQWNDGKTANPLDSTIFSAVHLTATFELATPGLTPEGEVTVQGNRFVDEHGKIVGSPRLTEHGEFIDNGNSTSPVSLIGKFSVSSTKKVYFSPANLQYTRTSTSVDWSTGTWSFLAHQYSTVETAANPYCTENYGDKTVVGLFGWGTWGEGKTPNLTAYSNSNYTWSTDFSVPLGGYNDWRTLTKDEWIYLLSTRATGVTVNSTSDARYTLATINTDATEVKGMIIFPDGFAGSNTEDVTWGTINANSNYTTTCTSAGWNALEAANCLFLPAAGWRAINDNNDDCTRVGDINTWGYYWTSDASDNSTFSYTLKFYSQDVELDELALRRLGFSVRLVRDAE